MNQRQPIERPNSSSGHDLLLGGLISLSVFLIHWALVSPYSLNLSHYYTRIANNPFAGEMPPWGYRMLTSLIVYYLPFSIETGFRIVNGLSIVLTAITLVFISRSFSLSGRLPLIAPIPYLLSYGVHFQIETIWFQDALTHLLLAFAVLAFLHRRDDWVACISAFGAFNRITALFFILPWYIARFGWTIDKRSIQRLIPVWGPAILLVTIVRLILYPHSAIVMRDSSALILPRPGFMQYYFEDFFKQTPSILVLATRMFSFHTANVFFGILLPLFLVYQYRCPPIHRRLSLLALIVWLQFIVATDTFRLETNAFPVVIPMALLHFQNLTSGVKNRLKLDIGLGVFIFMIMLWDTVIHFRKQPDFTFPPSLAGGLFLLTTAWYIHKHYSQPREIPSSEQKTVKKRKKRL